MTPISIGSLPDFTHPSRQSGLTTQTDSYESNCYFFCCLLIRPEQRHAKTQKYPPNVNKIITRKNCLNIRRDEEKILRARDTVSHDISSMNEVARSRLREGEEPGGWKNREKMLFSERKHLSHIGRPVVQRLL